MRLQFWFGVLFVILVYVSPSITQAEPKKSSMEVFAERVGTLEKSVDRLKSKFADGIDNRIKEVMSFSADATWKQQQTVEMRQAKKEFLEGNRLPEHPLLIGLTVSFVEAVQAAKQPLESIYLKLLEEVTNQGNADEVVRLEGLKQRLRGVLVDVHSFGSDTTWLGTRRFANGDAVKVKLDVTKTFGARFEGVFIHDFRGVAPAHLSVSGSLNGSRIEFRKNGMLKGKNRELIVSGVVVGEMLYLKSVGRSPKGEMNYGDILLTVEAKKK